MGQKKTIRRILLFIAIALIAIDGFSQSSIPDGILFQALARDPSGVAAKGRTIHIKDAIIQSAANGNVVYCEKFTVEASDEGVFTITIGKGSRFSGVNKLTDIDWSAGPFFLNIKAAIEPAILTPEWKEEEQYVDMGSSQFWTVPFAFRAASVAGLELFFKAADTTGMLAPYLRKNDTSSLSNRIDQSLKIIDTLGMLSSYIKKTDTAFLNTATKDKLNIKDTASMLSAYLRKLDTAGMLSPYLRKTDTLFLINLIRNNLSLSDTANIISPYLLKKDTLSFTARILSKLNIADTASMLSPYLRKNDTLTLSTRINAKLNISDTTVMLAAYLKKNDTLSLSTRINTKLNAADTAGMLSAYLQKNDTLSLSTRINKKLNAADTASMLGAYLQKNDTISLSTRINERLNLTDTASMLGTYLQKKDTASLSTRIGSKLNASDTANMLNPFFKTSTAITELAARELTANKSTNTSLGSSDTLFPTQKAVKIYVDSVTANTIADASATQKGKIKLAGDLSGTADAPVIADGKITSSKIADSAVTLAKIQPINSGKLLGNASGATATVSEIKLGTGLSFSGDTLNATAAGGGSQIDTFSTNLMVYATNGLGKYAQGQTIPSKGKTAAQVLMDVITQTIAPTYTQPTVTVAGSPSAGTVEIGTALNITLSATFNRNDAGAQTTTIFSKNGSALGGNTDNIASLTAAVSYTTTVSYGQGAVKNNNLGSPDPTGQITAGSKTSSAINYTPQAKRYWGYAATTSPTDAEIRAALGGNSELSSARSKTSFDITISSGSNFIFFAYPASLGNLSSLTVGGFGSLPSFSLITRSFTNAAGYAQSYNIYINPNAFSTPVSNITTN